MMPTMKREKFDSMDFEELLEWAYENVDYVRTEDGLIAMAKHEIDEENLQMAVHILNAVFESDCPDDSYYLYDRCMGTLETPTPITCKEDLEDYIDFEEKYPELDEYNYGRGEREGKLLLIYDGMNGSFARLIKVDKIIDEGSLGDANEFFELAAPDSCFNPEVVAEMSRLYEEYTGKPATPADFKYAMWSQWS